MDHGRIASATDLKPYDLVEAAGLPVGAGQGQATTTPA